MNYIEVLDSIDAAVWGPPMIILLLGCHIYTTIRTKGIQRKLPLALKPVSYTHLLQDGLVAGHVILLVLEPVGYSK